MSQPAGGFQLRGEKLWDTGDPVFLQAPLYHRPFLDGQVLVEDGRSEGFGVEVKGERALLVEAGEEQFAAGGHLLCGGGAEHLLNVFGPGLGDELHLRLGHGDKQENVAAEQLHSAVDDLGAHGGLSQVGDPQNQRAAGLQAVEYGGSAQMVGLGGLGMYLGQRLDQLAQVRRAAAGQQALLNALAIGQQAHTVTGEERQLGQSDGCGAGVVELGSAGRRAGLLDEFAGHGDAGPHEPPAVEDDPDGLAALGLVLAGDETAAPRGGRPADVAQVVALAVLAQALEVAAQAPLLNPAQLQVNLAAAGQKYLLLDRKSVV